ncbi:hypothetical protein OS493_005762 [Desmophyllum pertusum]|uniref:Folate gamma-glutamyl hydrolase n=1 Tax=Desmophyllum pertusum TaxID=174260 RepID=A0A9X0CHS3_9CNID|nr:hypothetical protein OS493_005762 [Desmophyllum pertusum]
MAVMGWTRITLNLEGIVTQETSGALTPFGSQYIVAAYVKFLESAGARAAPILVILPGGHVKLNQSGYTPVGKRLLELAIKAYDEKGEVFPIWGECLGLELVAMIISGRNLSLGQEEKRRRENGSGQEHDVNVVLHEFYSKDIASKSVVNAKSALSWSCKRTILTQEVLRILLNCSTELPWKTTVDHVNHMMLRLQYYGYGWKFRTEVVRSSDRARREW